MSDLTPAQKIEYEQLISACADHVGEPVCGKPGIDQLPRLKPEDIALVMRCFAIDVLDNLDIAEHFESFASDIEAQDFCRLGARVAVLLERACRETLRYETMVELERREQEEAEEYAQAHPESLESIHGVGATFR